MEIFKKFSIYFKISEKMSYANPRIDWITLFKGDVTKDGKIRYWIFMNPDYLRLYAKDTLDELVEHLEDLKKMSIYKCEKVKIRKENKKEGVIGFEKEEIERLKKIVKIKLIR